MSKEFKEFDHKFTKEQIRACRKRWLVVSNESLEAVRSEMLSVIKYWPFGYVQPDTQHVRFCVYEHDDADRWQLFRVSMKGLSTQEKVVMLRNRFIQFNCNIVDYGKLLRMSSIEFEFWCDAVSIREWIRINNYIGALRRGGQLNDRMEIVK